MREPGMIPWTRKLAAIFKPEGDTSPLPFARFASPAVAIIDEDLTVTGLSGLSSAETNWGSMRERLSRSSAPMTDLRCILVRGFGRLEGHANSPEIEASSFPNKKQRRK